MTTFFKEHPTLVFPQWAIDLGFEDESWHNDACARTTLRFPKTIDERADLLITLWVNYPEYEDREIGPRFGLVMNDAEDYECLLSFYSGENEEGCRLTAYRVQQLLRTRS